MRNLAFIFALFVVIPVGSAYASTQDLDALVESVRQEALQEASHDQERIERFLPASSPDSDLVSVEPDGIGDLLVALTFKGHQNDTGPLNETLLSGSGSHKVLRIDICISVTTTLAALPDISPSFLCFDRVCSQTIRSLRKEGTFYGNTNSRC